MPQRNISRLRKTVLSKRGADTNQNIFYLVIAVILLAAAAFGFDQALKSMNRAEARTISAAVSNQTRAMFANVGDLPTGLSAATVVNADVLPGNAVSGTNIILPNGGTAAIANVSAAPRDFAVTYTWTAASSRARGICNALTAGATPGPVGTGTRVQSGALGMDYTITSADCAAAAATLTAQYHR